MSIQSGIILTDNGDGTANVQMGPAGYTRDLSSLFGIPNDSSETIMSNVGTFLREAGFSSLTQEAIDAVAAHDFRY